MNPRYVLRNWMAESAIRRAETNDFSEVCSLSVSLNVRQRWTLHWFDSCIFCCYQVGVLHQVLSSPFVTQEAAEAAGYAARPPTWAESLRVSCSSWIVRRRKDSGKTCSTRIHLNYFFFFHRNAFSNTINCRLNKMFYIKFVKAQVSYLPINKRQSPLKPENISVPF